MTHEGILLNALEVIEDPILRALCQEVIEDPAFAQGYGAKSHHHNYQGGLYVHTAEVVQTCLQVRDPTLNRQVLMAAAIWHDYCKIHDYTLAKDGSIQYTKYKEQIYHISGSTMEFHHRARVVGLDTQLREAVEHCILAHHCRPEWGSPVSPRTKEAWTLHYADCMSAWFTQDNGSYREKVI